MHALLAKLEEVGVPAGPINTLEQVFSDPHVVHRGMKLDIPSAAAKAGTIPGIRTPITLDGEPMAASAPAPRLGRAHAGDPARDRRSGSARAAQNTSMVGKRGRR